MTYALSIPTFSLCLVLCEMAAGMTYHENPMSQVTGSGLDISLVDGSQLPESMVPPISPALRNSASCATLALPSVRP